MLATVGGVPALSRELAGHSIGQGQEEEQLEMGNVAELGAEDGNR